MNSNFKLIAMYFVLQMLFCLGLAYSEGYSDSCFPLLSERCQYKYVKAKCVGDIEGCRFSHSKVEQEYFAKSKEKKESDESISFKAYTSLSAIATGNNISVAVGKYRESYLQEQNKGTIVVSRNGGRWERDTPGCLPSFNDVCFGKSMFVAVGKNGTIITSPDGFRWTKRDVGISKEIIEITYNGSFFRAYAFTQQDVVLYSEDGIKWRVDRESWINRELTPYLCWDNTRFISIDFEGNVFDSIDSIEWKSISKPKFDSVRTLACTNGKYFVLGFNSTIYRSIDSIKWEKVNYEEGGDPLSALAFGNGMYVVVGMHEAIYTSKNGKKWQRRDSGFNDGWSMFSDIVFDGTLFIIAASHGHHPILTSTDGLNWTGHNID